jgi:hypothetical protein
MIERSFDWLSAKWQRIAIFLFILLGILFTVSMALADGVHQPAAVIPPSAPIILLYGEGTPPAIQKVPGYSYLQTRPLAKGDLIIDARRYTVTGDDLYGKIPYYATRNYLKTGWDPKKTKMLVIVTNRNRSFSTSGSVSSSWSNTDTDNQMSQVLSKSVSSSLYASGSISPSFSQSWVSQRFSIIFMLIE